MPYTANDGWVARCGGSSDFNPTVIGFCGNDLLDTDALNQRLRQAFTFFRANGDRRYSAQSLMRLLTFADRIETAREGGVSINTDDLPSVVVVEIPYEYDDETEVKSGGVVGMAVMLPDDKLMIAVHRNKRCEKIGTAIVEFVRAYFGADPAIWVHRNNLTGAGFCLSRGLRPWAINPQGAVQWSVHQPYTQDCEAVDQENDAMVEDLARRHNRNGRRSRPQPSLRSYDEDGLEIWPRGHFRLSPLAEARVAIFRAAGTVTLAPEEWPEFLDDEPDYDDSEY